MRPVSAVPTPDAASAAASGERAARSRCAPRRPLVSADDGQLNLPSGGHADLSGGGHCDYFA
jgi:hypothetical protein